MPHLLFDEIKAFLARGSQPNNDSQVVPEWSRNSLGQPDTEAQFLRSCILARGELSIQFLMFSHLSRNTKYLVLPEFPLETSGCEVDLLVVDAYTYRPIAAIELKHDSVHQPNGVVTLISRKGFSIDSDYQKRFKQRLLFNSTSYKIGVLGEVGDIPLIQVGLLTAIYSPVYSKDHPVRFVNTYCGTKTGPLSCEHAKRSHDRYKNATVKAHELLNEQERCARYSKRSMFDWGPEERFTLPTALEPVQVVGRVGYICLMT